MHLPLVIGLLACTGSNQGPDAAITHTATLTPDGVFVDFVLSVPEGARNVRFALGDGEVITDDLAPGHLYPLNAVLEVRLNWDDDADGGTVAEPLSITQNPVPFSLLGLPTAPARTLLAVNHYGFTHNYDANEAAYPILYEAFAAGWASTPAGGTEPITGLSVDFFASRDGEPRREAVPAAGDHARLTLTEPHVRIPSWYLDETELHAGGFSMPQVNGSDAPEPDLPKFLQNAHFPIDAPLDLALAVNVTGAAHGLVYTLVGAEGRVQHAAPSLTGTAPVVIEPAELASLGPGLVGVYAALYSQILTEGQVVQSVIVGYVPIWLDEAP